MQASRFPVVRRVVSFPSFVLVRTLVITFVASACWGATPAAGDGLGSGCALSGVVRDMLGLPVSGAQVNLTPEVPGVSTDSRGHFCFAAVAPGHYEAMATAGTTAGLARAVALVDLDAGPLVLNLDLSPVPFTETLVVTATRTEKRLGDAPVRTDVVSRESIERTASRTLADAIEYTTGVRVENNCQNCNFQQIRLLGLDGAYSQILIDGSPLVSSLAQVYGVEHIPAQMVERIEVVKGGGSAVYGPGSVAGVVNVITRLPTRSGATVDLRHELVSGQAAPSLGLSGDWVPRESTRASAFTQLDRVDPVDLSGDGFTEIGRRRFAALGLRLEQRLPGDGGRLRLDAGRVYEDRRGGDRLDRPEHEAEIAESVESVRYTSSVSFDHRPSPRWDYRLNGSFVHTSRDSYYGSGRDPDAYGFSTNPLVVLDAQVNHYRSKRILSLGLQWSFDHLEDEQPAYARFTSDTYRTLGAYIQDDWALSRGVQLLYGVRLDRHSALDAAVLSPRAALRVSPRVDWALRASIARGFRAPQVFDEDLHITQVGGEGQIIRNAPDLDAESSTNVVLSSEWTPRIGGANALFEASFFHTRIDDLFHVQAADDPDSPGAEFVRTNAGRARVLGLEMNVGVALGARGKVEVGLVEQRSRFDEPEPHFGSRQFFRTPDRYGLLSLTLRQPGLGELFLGARYTGRMKVPHYAGYIPEDRLEISPRFLVVDANVSRTFLLGSRRRLTVGAGVRNLADSYQQDIDQGPERDSGYVYGPRSPRSVFVSAKVAF